MRAMQPVTHELRFRHAFALRDLRFVMRKDVIDAAAVDVDLIAQQGRGHGTAFDVPAGTARSPGESHFTAPSSSSHAFHNAKSPMCSLSYSSCFTRPVDFNCVRSKCASFP